MSARSTYSFNVLFFAKYNKLLLGKRLSPEGFRWTVIGQRPITQISEGSAARPSAAGEDLYGEVTPPSNGRERG